MQQKSIDYADGAQKLNGECIFPANRKAQQAAVIVFPAFEGRGAFAIDYAKNIAKKGFIAFAADMYGDAQTAETIDGCYHLISPFLQDRQLVRKRALLAYQALLQQPEVNRGQIGAIGFCFGGMCALELARSGQNLQACVSIHGVLAKSALPTHPIKSKVLALHGYRDPQVPPEQLLPFAKEMEEAGVEDWTFTFFGNAKHSFTDPRTGTFDPQKEKTMGREYHQVAAERSFRYAMDFFQEHLAG